MALPPPSVVDACRADRVFFRARRKKHCWERSVYSRQATAPRENNDACPGPHVRPAFISPRQGFMAKVAAELKVCQSRRPAGGASRPGGRPDGGERVLASMTRPTGPVLGDRSRQLRNPFYPLSRRHEPAPVALRRYCGLNVSQRSARGGGSIFLSRVSSAQPRQKLLNQKQETREKTKQMARNFLLTAPLHFTYHQFRPPPIHTNSSLTKRKPGQMVARA